MTPDPQLSEAPDEEELERQRAEAETRGPLRAHGVRRHAWLNSAGPLGAVILGFCGAMFYRSPIKVIRWLQTTGLGWSGVTQADMTLDEGTMTYFFTGGY